MKTKLMLIISILLVLSFVLAACGSPATQAPVPAASEAPNPWKHLRLWSQAVKAPST